MEHRACMRSPLKLPITIKFEGREIYCTTRDFGLGGICLELDNTLLVPGAEAKLVFSLHQEKPAVESIYLTLKSLIQSMMALVLAFHNWIKFRLKP